MYTYIYIYEYTHTHIHIDICIYIQRGREVSSVVIGPTPLPSEVRAVYILHHYVHKNSVVQMR